jgi:hypothetical protein
MRTLTLCVVLLVCSATGATEDLSAVQSAIADSVRASHPVVIQVHLALCDNTVIRCGGAGLGDGDSLRTNLYWSTSEGLRGWLTEQPTGWHLVAEDPPGTGARITRSVWQRSITPGATWRALGVERAFPVYLVIDVWRGSAPAIDAATAAFARDLYDTTPRVVRAGGLSLDAGGAAHVIAWVGHNRWMDYERFSWPSVARQPRGAKGVIAIACYSQAYLASRIEASGNLALTVTRDFVMASGAPLVGALDALLGGRDLQAIRVAATAAYAKGQGKDPARLRRVFSNPAARDWR